VIDVEEDTVESAEAEVEKDVFVRREPISKTCEITQADNLYCRGRLSMKTRWFKVEVMIKDFLA